MKWYLKLLKSFLFVLLINLIILLSISFNIKQLLIDGIMIETITENIIKPEYNTENYIISEEQINTITDDEKIREILKSKEVQELLNKYLDITVDTIIDEETIEEVELEKDIIDYLNNNKESLSKAVGQEITEEMINKTQEQLEGKDMTKSFKQTLINTKNHMSNEEKIMIKGYKVLQSNILRIIVIFCIIITLILIAIIENSFYKWIHTLGVAITISGLLLIGMNYILKQIIWQTTKSFVINSSSFLYSSIMILLIGIFIITIYSITVIIINKKKGRLNNDIS